MTCENVFKYILQALFKETGKYLLVRIDSTFCRVHQHAAGAKKKHDNQAIGVSRGGKTTKIHMFVTELLSKVNLEGKTVLGDKAFCSAHIRNFIQSQGGAICIPDKSDALIKHDFDAEPYNRHTF